MKSLVHWWARLSGTGPSSGDLYIAMSATLSHHEHPEHAQYPRRCRDEDILLNTITQVHSGRNVTNIEFGAG